MEKIEYKQIGIIRSPFKEPKGTPIQATSAKGVKGTIEIFPEYAEGLHDLEDFSHIILLYHFHLCRESSLKVKPFMDEEIRGVFATRAPCRPNPIGISIMHLLKIEENILYIEDIDVIDKTPLLDIKPYVPEFNPRNAVKKGWLTHNIHKLSVAKDDGRFTK